MNDVARVQLEGISLRAGGRQHDGRIKRADPAGGTVGHEVNIRKLLWLARQIRRGSGPIACEYLLLIRVEMFLDALHFSGCFAQFRIVRAGGHRIAQQKQAAGGPGATFIKATSPRSIGKGTALVHATLLNSMGKGAALLQATLLSTIGKGTASSRATSQSHRPRL